MPIWLPLALRLALQLELGPEFDSNANRAEFIKNITTNDAQVGSLLLRTAVKTQLRWTSSLGRTEVSGVVARKTFFSPEANDQHTWVARAELDQTFRLPGQAALGIWGHTYDITQAVVPDPCDRTICNRHRDFRNSSFEFRYQKNWEVAAIALSAGYQSFEWKADQNLSFQSGLVRGLVRIAPDPKPGATASFQLSVNTHLERRLFSGLRIENHCPPDALLPDCLRPGDQTRQDWFAQMGIDGGFTYKVIVNLGYALQWNSSDSYGFSLIRHVLTAKIATPLFWRLVLSAKGQLMLSRSLDVYRQDPALFMPTLFSFEDENRNALIFHLERRLGHSGVSVEARVSLFGSELSSYPSSYSRQVYYLGVAYGFERSFDGHKKGPVLANGAFF